ncbi:hypothetical protein BKA62DRAFT_478838 [Auriculariales sp. MPI-PUGE-AT-0066]|nr:hypothetical protein BKA62DRAFT_478838 [Auriculariales sp. MPI-PUGE-AT-0066]
MPAAETLALAQSRPVSSSTLFTFLHRLVQIVWLTAVEAFLALQRLFDHPTSQRILDAVCVVFDVGLALPVSALTAIGRIPVILAPLIGDCLIAVLLMPFVAPLAVIGLALLGLLFTLRSVAAFLISISRDPSAAVGSLPAPTANHEELSGIVPLAMPPHILVQTSNTVSDSGGLSRDTCTPESSMVPTPTMNCETVDRDGHSSLSTLPSQASMDVHSVEHFMDRLRNTSTQQPKCVVPGYDIDAAVTPTVQHGV